MRNRIIIPLFFFVFLGFHFLSIAQFTQEELAERSKWEEFLKDAKIVSFYQQKSREAVTEPWTLTLEKDGIKRNVLWKDVEGRGKGFLENWKWEIAAYRLDKYLGLNMRQKKGDSPLFSCRGCREETGWIAKIALMF